MPAFGPIRQRREVSDSQSPPKTTLAEVNVAGRRESVGELHSLQEELVEVIRCGSLNSTSLSFFFYTKRILALALAFFARLCFGLLCTWRGQ